MVNVAASRNVDGHFDDYLQWLATTRKEQRETAKKAAPITGYRVYAVEARGLHAPDIYLVSEYRNRAALDGIGNKLDAVSAQVEGSVEKANRAEIGRGRIRTVLGSPTMQAAELMQPTSAGGRDEVLPAGYRGPRPRRHGNRTGARNALPVTQDSAVNGMQIRRPCVS